MKNRKQKDAPPETPQQETVTPFFARYLEGQEPDAEASVGARGGRAEFTYSGAKKTSKKSSSKKSSARKSGGAKAGKSAKSARATAKAPAQTMKYPSDNDELVFFPYKAEAIEVTEGLRATRKYPSDLDEAVTLKYPSDDDEVGYYPTYVSAADVPKGRAAAKPKEGRVQLSRKRPK